MDGIYRLGQGRKLESVKKKNARIELCMGFWTTKATLRASGVFLLNFNFPLRCDIGTMTDFQLVRNCKLRIQVLYFNINIHGSKHCCIG